MMSTTNTSTVVKAIKVQYAEAIENFRECRLDCLKMDFKPVLDTLEGIQEYARELDCFSTDLMSLVNPHIDGEQRFKSLRQQCRDGGTPLFFPMIMDEIESGEVVLLIYEGDKLIGTLTDKDLSF